MLFRSMPFSRLARHFHKAGCAVAGWCGAEKISRRRAMILTDGDLFPPGTIQLNGVKVFGEDLPRVFEKGFTGYNGRADKKSTGIGLYLCKKIMDKLRHGIYIESEVDQGTTVYLYLEREK